MLATTAFERAARYQARAMGYPDIRIIFIDHPLGGLAEDAARAKADGAVDSLVEFFGA